MAVSYSAMHTGPGRGLTAVYGIFALAATARAGVQLIRDYHEAPLAYSLSALAAVVYIVATVCLVIGSRTSHRIAVAATRPASERRSRDWRGSRETSAASRWRRRLQASQTMRSRSKPYNFSITG